MTFKNKNNKNRSPKKEDEISPMHLPVLLPQVLQCLAPEQGESYLDATAGYGGHASKVLERTLSPNKATLVDRDSNAVEHLREHFAEQKVNIMHTDFYQAGKALVEKGEMFDMILADLGVSSPHLDNTQRGFSFMREAPLDMRMDDRQAITAADIVNSAEQGELIRILKEYGEEPKARQIARLIAEHRPFTTTTQLASIVSLAWPGHSKVHPATRTFQALRLAVNDELELLRLALPLWLQLLQPGGRLAVISFHSLEDRIVKQFFAEHAGDRYDAEMHLLTKRPLTATPDELVSNPRARSAKLRAAVKIKKEREIYANSGKN